MHKALAFLVTFKVFLVKCKTENSNNSNNNSNNNNNSSNSENTSGSSESGRTGNTSGVRTGFSKSQSLWFKEYVG